MSEPISKQKLFNVVMVVLVVFLSAEVVLLVFQNRRLQKTLTEFTTGPTNRGQLKPGEQLPVVDLKSLDGSTMKLEYQEPQKKHLVFIFTSTCPHCEATFPKWKQFADEIGNKSIITLGVCLDNLETTKELAEKRTPNFPMFSANDTSFSRLYKISGVPQTLLVDGNGKVEKIWVGELNKDNVAEVENSIHSFASN